MCVKCVVIVWIGCPISSAEHGEERLARPPTLDGADRATVEKEKFEEKNSEDREGERLEIRRIRGDISRSAHSDAFSI